MKRAFLAACCGLALCGVAHALTLSSQNPPTVVRPDDADSYKEFAARELTNHLHLILGVDIPLLYESENTLSTNVLFVGIWAPGDGAPLDYEEARYVLTNSDVAYFYGEDHHGKTYHGDYKVIDEATHLDGNRCGTLFAVYEFLEYELDVHWISPWDWGLAYEPTNRVTLATKRHVWVPPLRKRHIRTSGWRWGSLDNDGSHCGQWLGPGDFRWDEDTAKANERQVLTWCRRMRLGRSEDIPFGHSFGNMWSTYGATHPEYFALNKFGEREPVADPGDIKLCVSNTNLHQVIVNDWLDANQGAPPDAKLFLRACPNDGVNFCECSDCLALDEPLPEEDPLDHLTDRYVFFWNGLITLARQQYTNAWVTGYAYSRYREPPRRETCVPGIILGFVAGKEMERDEAGENWGAWRDAGVSAMGLRPNQLYAARVPVMTDMDEKAFDIYHIGRTNNMIATDYDTVMGNWAKASLCYYVVAKAHRDWTKSYSHWFNEYLSTYGAAAADVQAYFDHCHDIFETNITLEARLKYGAAFWSEIDHFFDEADFTVGSNILQTALSRNLTALEQARVEQLVRANDHIRLTVMAIKMARQGSDPQSLTATQALWDYRWAHKSDLQMHWPWVFATEVPRYGDDTRVRYWAPDVLGQPPMPADVKATPKSSSRIDITWTDNCTNEMRYKIDRHPAGDTNWVRVGTVESPHPPKFIDTGLATDSTYYYQVKAYHWGGNGPYGPVVSARTLSGINLRPSYDTDDAEENVSTGEMSLRSTDLEMVDDGGVQQLVGLRFAGVSVPQGASINEAYLQFTVDETNAEPTSLTIHGQAIDHALVFTSSDDNISDRDTTAAFVTWGVPAWDTVDESDTDQRTPDLTAIIEEIVDRPGWLSGNALAMIISGSGKRVAQSYDKGEGEAPLLHIHYSVPQTFVAYNDLAWFTGQLTNKITWYTTTNDYPTGQNVGYLKDYETGQNLNIRVTIEGGDNQMASQGLHPVPGTDAHSVFDGKVNGAGCVTYHTDDLVLTLNGLSPDVRYEFVLYADRNGSTYVGGASRYHYGTLSGAASFVNGSTVGTTVLTNLAPDDTTLYNAGLNNQNGLVTRFRKIDPGSDGQIVVTLARNTNLNYYTYANAFALTGYSFPEGSNVVKIAKGASWKYRKGTDECSDPSSAWRALGFNDGGWAEGDLPIGYGDGPYGTSLADMRGGYMSVFLRRPFQIQTPTMVSELELWTLYDDGFIAWINGDEVGRTNITAGPGVFVPHDTPAPVSGESREWNWLLQGRTLPRLVAGTNMLAVQLFNCNLSSSDLTLDVELSVLEGTRVLHDRDRDGMSDPWEETEFGGTNAANAGTEQDLDNDGHLNIEEYIAGTDPSNQMDRFRLNVDASATEVIVSLPAREATGEGYEALDRFYALEFRSALEPSGVWAPVPGYEAVLGAGQTISCTNSSTNGLTLYRGRVWLELE